MFVHDVQVFAGFISTFIFISSNFPMIYKALTTRNLKSYSLGQIGMANLGNLIHWLYMTTLPPGPIWFLHAFHTAVAVVMLALYLKFEFYQPSRSMGGTLWR